MRALFGIAVGSITLACGAPNDGTRSPARAYLEDRAFRRSELVASLTTSDNQYAAERLAHYATGDADDWERLPSLNPETTALESSDLDDVVGIAPAAYERQGEALALPADPELDESALVKPGSEAFFRYPVEPLPLPAALLTAERAASFGLWTDAEYGVGGLVVTSTRAGAGTVSITCSTCHASPGADGRLVPGLPNRALDLGAMLAAGASPDDAVAAHFAAWGPGRVDVMSSDGSLPVRIPDLRPTRFLTHLHADATVIQRDLPSLAIRIETLLIGTTGAVGRPPPLVALALASYVRSLADQLPEPPAAPSVFEERCSGCHAGPGLTGAPRPLELVGTDPSVGLSPDRGTGFYRVPSLRGVATRGPLLHDGTLGTLADLFDPSRLDAEFTRALHRSGPVAGHAFGLDLDPAAKDALLTYLSSL